MKSTTYSCNKYLFTHGLKKNLWFIAVASIVWLFMLPIPILSNHFAKIPNKTLPPEICYWTASGSFSLILMIAPVIAALLVFRFLNHKGQSDFMHSLPCPRRSLFLSHYCSGFILFALPMVINALIALILLITPGTLWYTPMDVLNWLGYGLFMSWVVYSYAIFAGSMLGVTVLQGIFTYILLFLLPGLDMLVNTFLNAFLPSRVATYWNSKFMFLYPILSIGSTHHYYGDHHIYFTTFEHISYGIIALLLSAIAYYLYTKRPVEAATQSVVFKPLSVFLKYLAAFCSSLCMAAYLFGINNSVTWYYIGAFIGGLLGYSIAQGIITKSFKAVLKLKGFVPYVIIVNLLFGIVHADLIGFENRVPDLAQLQGAYIHSMYDDFFDDAAPSYHINGETPYFKDPDTLKRIVALQKALIESDANSQEHINRGYNDNRSYNSYTFDFKEKIGQTFSRRYSVDSSQYKLLIDSIMNSQEIKNRRSPLTSVDRNTVKRIVVTSRFSDQSVVLEYPQYIDKALKLMDEEIHSTPWVLEDYHKLSLINFSIKGSYENDLNNSKTLYSHSVLNLNSHLIQFLKEEGLYDSLDFDTKKFSKIIVRELSSEESKKAYYNRNFDNLNASRSIEITNSEEIFQVLNAEVYNIDSIQELNAPILYALELQRPNESVDYFGLLGNDIPQCVKDAFK